MADGFGEILLGHQLRLEYIQILKKIEEEGTVSQEEFERKFKVKI